ncbi:MAG TPA: efflux transporter outer membrane subunit [Burkholderiales bacterium]|nr:efflux transporter outer membrane subunit [Burkholderiales bacterium]
MNRHLRLLPAAVAMAVAGCMHVGDDYVRPKATFPAAYVDPGPWKQAAPSDQAIRGKWWEIYGDATLNRLEEQASGASPRIQIAAARVEQARAILGFSKANAYPTVTVGAVAPRMRVSGNRVDQPDKLPAEFAYYSNDFQLPLYASYELDFWGKYSRLEESARARMESSIAAYHGALLTLQSDLAQAYFQLRAAEEEVNLLASSIELRERARDLVGARKRGGLASELDLARVETELAATQAEAQAAIRHRDELLRALALLTGSAPGPFEVEAAPLAAQPPVVPVGMPADLLERRPDIAEAERQLAARSADIGYAQAAWFPSIKLTGSFGFESNDLSALFDRESMIWSVGASLSQTVFDGGRIRANIDRARAIHAEYLAEYRERLLVAFKEVETALAALRILDLQHESQLRAASSAERAEYLATARYKTGLVNVLELVDAQRTKLQVERGRLQIRQQQMLASVALIRALGGGWAERRDASGTAWIMPKATPAGG